MGNSLKIEDIERALGALPSPKEPSDVKDTLVLTSEEYDKFQQAYPETIDMATIPFYPGWNIMVYKDDTFGRSFLTNRETYKKLKAGYPETVGAPPLSPWMMAIRDEVYRERLFDNFRFNPFS